MENGAYITENELFAISEITGMSVEEVMKDRIRKRKAISDWHLAHAEFGELRSVEISEGNYGGSCLKLTWIPRLSASKDEKTARTCFLPGPEARKLHSKCISLIGKRCVFFISSSTKMSRFVLDVERFEEIEQ